MMLLTIDSDLTEVTCKSLIFNILQHKINGKCVQLFRYLLIFFLLILLQENLQILRDLSLLQIQMRDLEGYRVS